MSIRLALLLIAAVPLVTSCSSTGHLSVSGGAASGPDLTVQHRNRVDVRLLTPRFSRDLDHLPKFLVTVTNQGAAPVTIRLSDINAFSGAAPVRVYTSSELAQQIRREAAFNAFTSSARASNDLRVVGTSPATPQGMRPAILISATGLNEAVSAQWTERRRLSNLPQMFHPNEVAGHSSFRGVVVLHAEDIVRDRPLALVVTFANEEYRFSFD